ncbi:MAG: sigma 54-interacting transcriptional regulator [Gemmatimonadetes bacterium]|nr:sigma 54-interacting transcriptional regulator [Gemmatimonadota bacterium]
MIKSLDRTGTWRTYSIADGLAGMRVEHIVEDNEGYLWFATWDNGVSRFDGDEFRNFTRQDGLISDSVYFVSQDSQRRLWFGTLNGLCWYDGADFHHLEDNGIADRTVQSIYEDGEGRVWFGGHRTLGYYDGTVFHDLIPLYLQHYEQPPSPQWSNLCWGITQDPQGHLWFGFDYPIRFDGQSFHRYDEKEGFPRDGNVYSVGKDPAGKVWIGRLGHRDGLWCYADGSFQSVQVDLGGKLRKIQCDCTGRMWFSTSEGVLYQDGDGFNRFTPADGLPHPAVKSVFRDRDHQYWFATWGGVGLYDTQISVFDLSTELSSNVSEVSQLVQDRRGDIWVGCVVYLLNPLTKSVFRFDGEHVAFAGTEYDFDINNCFAIYEDHEGYLWFGGRNGLFRYDGQKVKKIETIADLDGKSVSAITQDAQGGFLLGYWENSTGTKRENIFASALTLTYQRGEEFQTIFVENEKKDPFSSIGTVIAGRNSEVYFHLTHQNFSDNYKGFARWHPKDGLKFYGMEDGLIDHQITDLLLDRAGNLWVATQSGLSFFDGNVFHNFTTADGLPSDRIRCLLEDRQGHLWLGTDGGVAHYDGQLFQTIKSPYIGSVSQILEDRDGNFWFGTVQSSLVRYRQRQTSPQIRLLQVNADHVYENIILSTAGQQVIFEYKGLSFSTHPRDMLYVYRLKGYDSDWQPATRKMRAHYRDLPPDDYTFQVRAIDRDLNHSEIAQVQLLVEEDPRIEALTTALNSQGSKEFIGQSTALHEFQIQLRKVASTDLTVLFKGETGVGKGLAARALHTLSAHRDGPFMQVNCGALPATLIDSELFGHERGAFTSAVVRRLGKVELAKGGTLFLDEVGDMSLETQARMLRLLDEGTFERIGGSETLEARTRIVAATNRDLEEMISAGNFREDLYYRLNTFPIYLPPLRERKEDIPDLSEYFKNRMAAHIGKQLDPLTSEVIEVLQAYNWPGNVRELEHTIQRAVTVCNGLQIEVGDLGLYGSQIKGTVQDHKRRTLPDQAGEIMPLDEFERDYILKVLKVTKWKIKGADGAATLLGLPPSTLYTKMKKLGIKRLSQRTL